MTEPTTMAVTAVRRRADIEGAVGKVSADGEQSGAAVRCS